MAGENGPAFFICFNHKSFQEVKAQFGGMIDLNHPMVEYLTLDTYIWGERE
jgi:hypothetical protein